MSVICNAGPTRVVHREGNGESRWCFQCRARAPFEYVVAAPTDPESWYGPTPSIQCQAGHLDGDLFPGRAREWKD